jgi:hypothetical protein
LFHCSRRISSTGAPGSAGIVDEDINAAEGGEGSIDHGVHVCGIFYIAAECESLHGEFLQFFGGLHTALFFSSAQDDISALFGECFGHLAPKPDRAAGDDSGAAREVEEFAYGLRGVGQFAFLVISEPIHNGARLVGKSRK